MNHVREPEQVSALHDVRRTIETAHYEIRALFKEYLSASADARRPIVDSILKRLASHLQWEEDFWYRRLKEQGDRHSRFADEAFREHDEVKSMIQQIEGAESDDDEALDQYFEDMMQTATAHFQKEEQALHVSS
jgi:hemerythrin superfamily protein